MDNKREKLIELLMDMPFGNSTEEAEEAHAEAVAEYLIDNGVTFTDSGPRFLIINKPPSKDELMAFMDQPIILSQDHADIIPIVPYRWIPVTERLPEVVDHYLVVVKSKYDYENEYCIDTDVAIYNPYERAYIDGCWTTFNDWDEGQQYLHVTHWMPLPQPPKGE